MKKKSIVSIISTLAICLLASCSPLSEEEVIELSEVSSVKESLKSAIYGSNGWVIDLPKDSEYFFAMCQSYILRYDIESNTIDKAVDLSIINAETFWFSATFETTGEYAIIYEWDDSYHKINLHLLDFEMNEIKFLLDSEENF